MAVKSKGKTSAPSVEDPFFNIEEAARYLGQTTRWIKGQLEAGTLPYTRMGRLLRFRKSALDAYIAANTTTPKGR